MEVLAGAFVLAGAGLLGWISNKGESSSKVKDRAVKDRAIRAISDLADELRKIDRG